MPPHEDNQIDGARTTVTPWQGDDDDGGTVKIRLRESTAAAAPMTQPRPQIDRRSSFGRNRQPPERVTVERHFYKAANTNTKIFEQSLDVYRPVFSDEREGDSSDRPLVVLVVGSAWLGHQPFIYLGTSWWNASGPRTVAEKLGCTCVCIRHRGAFPKMGGDVVLAILVGVISAGFIALVGFWMKMRQQYGAEIAWNMTVGNFFVQLCVFLPVSWLLLILAGQNDAALPEMWDDVTDAMKWVQDHRQELDGGKSPLIFGGYSSGGHVAATLLQRPQLWTKKGLPDPSLLINGIMYLSGVLAVREWPEENVDANEDEHRHQTMWLTRLITHVVFGVNGTWALPSPLHDAVSCLKDDKKNHKGRLLYGTSPPPLLPHLLVGCKHEVFGIDWMNVMFASRPYAEAMSHVVPTKYIEVPSNHWSVLNSPVLASGLRYGLCKWMMEMALEDKKKAKTLSVE